MTREQLFLDAVARRNLVRPRVAAIVLMEGEVLVQRPADDPRACYACIGGEYEVGDSFESRIRKEFEEETTARVLSCRYLFVVENRFYHNGALVQGVEHYLEVQVDRKDIESREPHLAQHWLPLARLRDYDLRPHVVRDAIADGTFRVIRHMIVPLDSAP
jgi:ADP-ribose pyrophosphatase YjhB (NUDIX family)